MMKKKYILMMGILLSTSLYCYSQVLDHAQLECLYRYEMLGDRLRQKAKDEVILLVGDQYCAYFSYMNHVSDSLVKVDPTQYAPTLTDANGVSLLGKNQIEIAEAAAAGRITVGPPRTHLPFNILNQEHYFTNRISGEVECMDRSLFTSDRFYYKEIPEKPRWKIGSDTCTVAGYRCQKATARYGGREWTAWFSPEIALSEGPWKLRGLPGLILKAETADGEFALTCTSIRRSTGRPIVKDEQHKYQNVSKEELFKIKKLLASTQEHPIDLNFIEQIDSK